MTDVDRLVDAVDDAARNRPGYVVLGFLLVTVIAAGGIGMVGTDAGADQFTEDVPAQEAMEEMEEDFEVAIGENVAAAQLFVVEDNVLDRDVLVRTLEIQHRLEERSTVRVTSTTSHANAVATELDPGADTPADQRRAIESATDRELAIATADAEDMVAAQVDTEFNPTAQQAGTAIVGVTYDVPETITDQELAAIQVRSTELIDSVGGVNHGDNAILFGSGIMEQEVGTLLGDTAIVVFPAALLLILLFLLVAYRDPIDMLLGLSALGMSMIWTFGAMGYLGIPFSDAIITVIPLLLAVGIDFGIHVINRYREERAAGGSIEESMIFTTDQLLIAFLLVTVTTVVSFAANLVSTLTSIQDFGLVAALGMIATFLIFGIYLPAAKVLTDRFRERWPIPDFNNTPLGAAESRLGRVLHVGVDISRIAPTLVVVAVLLVAAIGGAYGTGVDTEFTQEAFFPQEDRIALYEQFPEPFAPGEYTFVQVIDLLEEEFDDGFVSTMTLYIDQSVRDDDSLELIDRTTHNPPDTIEAAEPGRAEAESVLTVIDDHTEADQDFASVVDRNDRLGNGVPDRNVDTVFDELFDSPAEDDARGYLAADRGSARVDFTVDPEADEGVAVEDLEAIAERTDLEAVPTGELVVNEAVIDQMLESSVNSLFIAFLLTAIFLTVTYRLLEGRVVYGLINLVPVLASVALLAGSMRLFGVSLTPINAPILSVAIGLGVDYTVHFTHRFVDEYEAGREIQDALSTTILGTGGALTGSMLTTVAGLGVLYLALIPLIQDFGLMLGLGVLYAYLCSIILVPSLVVVWDRYGHRIGLPLTRTEGSSNTIT